MDGYSDKGKFTPKKGCPTPGTCRLAGECQGGCTKKKKTMSEVEASKPYSTYSGRSGAYDFGGGGLGRASLRKPGWGKSTVRSGASSSRTYGR